MGSYLPERKPGVFVGETLLSVGVDRNEAETAAFHYKSLDYLIYLF